MMRQTYDLETVEPQELSIKVCVLFFNALSDKLYRDCGEKKKVFLYSFNVPKCIVARLLMVEWLFSLLF